MDHNVQRKDTTKGPPLRILSLDGGGVRGYSMFILLQELMHRTHVEMFGRAPRAHEIPKPCHHFDIIAGTGTGGLIAIMLGRLRLDLETCKEVYIRMTKRVFETDKTIAGIPIRSTLFKASKLEEAIRDCVREHTVFDDEGNDTLAVASPMTPSAREASAPSHGPGRSMSSSSRASISRSHSLRSPRTSLGPGTRPWGDPNALFAVAAVFRGTSVNDNSILLRSYDSRREPAPEVNCTIWEAGRATCATALAFKPIRIGQSVFLDEGAGKYNPSPQILDEAVINEYPNRQIGVFISMGTGRRPTGTSLNKAEWWESFMGGSMSDFAEARRKLISKIEGCEETHQYMLKQHLAKRGVSLESYYRLNVEVGVGEFGMNEWNRLSDISTNTRRYLAKEEVQAMNLSAATKLARIHRSIERLEKQSRPYSFQEDSVFSEPQPAAPSRPGAFELEGSIPNIRSLGHDTDKMPFLPQGTQLWPVYDDKIVVDLDAPPSDRDALATASTPDANIDHAYANTSPPPIPPKTPLSGSHASPQLYPRQQTPMNPDGPPPPVSLHDKPQYVLRPSS